MMPFSIEMWLWKTALSINTSMIKEKKPTFTKENVWLQQNKRRFAKQAFGQTNMQLELMDK